MDKLNDYTSTGIKFWLHQEQMWNYRNDNPNSIISTHISPEGACLLKCSYCSVAKRNKHERIRLDIIKDYVVRLKDRGLKACILTGGGESTLYPQFNELVTWLNDDMDLEIALITNGIVKVDQEILDRFTWVRVSINEFPNWQNRIVIPKIKGILGFSVVYAGQSIIFFDEVAKLADKLDAKYVRILPNCLLDGEELLKEHRFIEKLLAVLGDEKFFHQFKIHKLPEGIDICHQAYFRPYLSEVGGGTVFPCDSISLTDKFARFHEKYAICKPWEILDFLGYKLKMNFIPSIDCSGCVFSKNVQMLEDWKRGKPKININWMPENIIHKNFV